MKETCERVLPLCLKWCNFNMNSTVGQKKKKKVKKLTVLFLCVCSHDRGKAFISQVGLGRLITGMDRGLQGMCVNERRRITIPPHLAYGSIGTGACQHTPPFKVPFLPCFAPFSFTSFSVFIVWQAAWSLPTPSWSTTSSCWTFGTPRTRWRSASWSNRQTATARRRRQTSSATTTTAPCSPARPLTPGEAVFGWDWRIFNTFLYLTSEFLFFFFFLFFNWNFPPSSYSRNATYDTYLGQGDLIQGMEEGLLGMCVGERRFIIVPPFLAYGVNGSGKTMSSTSTELTAEEHWDSRFR